MDITVSYLIYRTGGIRLYLVKVLLEWQVCVSLNESLLIAA